MHKEQLTMSPLDEPHSLFFLLHVCAPFALVYETGDPRVAVVLVLLWELAEQIYYDILGDYGAIFAWEEGKETLWDVWALDVGGGFSGVLIALSLEYIRSQKKVEGNFWRPFIPTPQGAWWVRVLRFLGIGAIAAFAAVFGWECVATIPEWCVNGYHAFPWGAPIIIGLFVLYIWWADFPKMSYAFLGFISVPVFIPVVDGHEPVPASFVQFINASSIAIFSIIGCIIHRNQMTKKTAMYKSVV